MRKLMLLAFLSWVSLPVMAEILTCEQLQTRVDVKLQAKGVQIYTLEIVPAEAASAVPAIKNSKGKEVGTCDGGTKRLIYTRGN